MHRTTNSRYLHGLIEIGAIAVGGLLLLGACAPAAPPVPTTAAPATPTTAPVAVPTTGPPTTGPTTRPTTVPPTTTATARPTTASTAGDVVFQEDFSAGSGYLGTYKDTDGTAKYLDGYYQILITGKNSYIYGATSSQTTGAAPKTPVAASTLERTSVDVDVVGFAGPADSNFGIACGWKGASDFYALLISNDGRHYTISRASSLSGTGGDFVALAGQDRGEAQPAIVTGIGAKNHLRAECGANGMSLAVNGKKIVETPVKGGVTGGIALLGHSRNGAGMEVQFDNLVVRKLAAEPAFAAAPSGQVLFRDDFSAAASGWPAVNKPGETTRYADGTYRVTLQADKNPLYAAPTLALDDFSAELDITQVSGGDKAYAGLTFRDGDKVGYYDVIIGSDGVFAIGKQPAGKDIIPLIDYTDNPAIKKGLNQVNHLRVDAIGAKITVYINGQKAGETTDAGFNAGYLQIEVGSPRTGPAEFSLDNFVVKRP